MYTQTWQKRIIKNPKPVTDYLMSRTGLAIVTDTETTGLNPVYDNPFVITMALKDPDLGTAFAFAYDIEAHPKEETERLIDAIYHATSEGLLIGHNLGFDLNMLANTHKLVLHNNLLDTTSLIRLGHDAVQERHGGAPLALKAYAKKYIDRYADDHQKHVKRALADIAKTYNLQLYKALGDDKKATMAFLDTFPNEPEDLPTNSRKIYQDWLNSLPEKVRINMTGNTVTNMDIPYNMIDREMLLEYAVYDAIYTYEIYVQLLPIVQIREQTQILKEEQALIKPLVEMTRVGFLINREYVKDAKLRMREYLYERIEKLHQLAGKPITQNQNAEIKNILMNKFGCKNLESTAEEVLVELSDHLKAMGGSEDAVEFIDTVLELRTLSKWYTTYLVRFSRQPEKYTHMYTSLNSSGTVTGRFTSDFQQFPKYGIKKKDGSELFDPRAMVKAAPGTYLFYADYSQIELRIQAMYTILIGHPDLNLCRAYMPYRCIHYATGQEYDSQTHNWDERQPDGKSAWIVPETGFPWIPVDLHAETTRNIFPNLDPHSPEFKKKRSEYGKRTNFACNYGAKPKKIHEMYPKESMEEAKRIYNAYVKTFPGVVAYQKWCYNLYNTQGWGANLYGRRYYGSNGHNGANAHIQGTGADLLKEVIIKLHDFLKPYKTRMQMNIHDEISFVLYPDELFLIPQIKHLMEDIPGTLVPIVAEIEISETTWAEKKGFDYDGESIHFRDDH